MNVRQSGHFGVGRKVSVEVVTWLVGEGRSELHLATSIVAQSAQVDLPVPRELVGVQYLFRRVSLSVGVAKVEADMVAAGSMAGFAANSQHHRVRNIGVGKQIGSLWLNVRSVALQASGDYRPREVGAPILVARTVDPSTPFCPEAHGKLE